MKLPLPQFAAPHVRSIASSFTMALAFVALLALPELALASPPATTDFTDDACAFVDNIKTLLTTASIAVVTIAIIFAGYQIAFAHKRISDVAPILIGGLLIGAAGQLATWLLGSDETDCTAMLVEATRYLA